MLACYGQVHGIVNDTLEFVRKILSVEINSTTDNPVSLRLSSLPPFFFFQHFCHLYAHTFKGSIWTISYLKNMNRSVFL